MKKIMIIGPGGVGKSTLAKELGHILQIDVIHLDAIFWKSGWTETPREKWIEKHKQLLKRESWIIDGNYGSTIDIRMASADTVIFLDFAPLVCVYGAISRRIKYHNKTRPDMGQDCPEKLDLEFLSWIWNYKKEKSPAIVSKLHELPVSTNVYHMKKRSDVRVFLANITPP